VRIGELLNNGRPAVVELQQRCFTHPSFFPKAQVNFKKVLIVVAIVVVAIVSFKYFTRVDRTNPSAVATAFTKAMKSKNTDAASGFVIPDQSAAWLAKTDEKLSGMKSGAKERYFERFPETLEFGTVATAAGKSTIKNADGFELEMSQVDGKWYVAKYD
jgi:hypothetical protein